MMKIGVSKGCWIFLVFAGVFCLLNGDVSAAGRSSIGENYPGEKENLEKIKDLTGGNSRNDTRDAKTLSGPELYALHKELRGLYNINTAPMSAGDGDLENHS